MKKYRNYIIFCVAILTLLISVCFIPISASRLIPIIEKQVADDFGIQVHIEKLILRLGPSLKIKTPVIHIMYEDGQKFAQFDSVKFYVPWSTLFKDDVAIRKIYAENLIIKQSSTDKYLNDIIKKIQNRNFHDNPNIFLKKYSISYFDKEASLNYTINGSTLSLNKLLNYKNYKLTGLGELSINNKRFLTYDLSIVPDFNIDEISLKDFDYNKLAEQLINLDFSADIIADLKIYNNSDNKQISGLVNIDNVSVLDKDKRAPKSFIYFTFLGNKIGILSNIYASQDKKICIDGVLNHSKKPEIDLKVKTDEINLSDLYKRIKVLVDYSYFKDINSLKGTMIADFNIKGDLNKIKSTGYMKIADASIAADGININKINSDIDFSNNVINITNGIGYVKEAPIMLRGKIDKTINIDILMNKVELKHMMPKTFGIQDGIISLSCNLTGTLDNIAHKENLQIDNLQIIQNNNNFGFNTLKFDTNKENTAYISNLIIKPEKTEIIKLPMLKLYVGKDTIKIPNTNIFMPNSKLQASADISNYNTKAFTFNTNLEGFINSRDIKDLISYTGNLPIKIRINGNKDVQNIESQVLLEKATFLDEPCIINLLSKIENNSLKIDDLSILAFNGNFSSNFKSNIKGQKKLTVTGAIENFNDKNFKNVRIFIPQILNLTIFDSVAQLKGDIFINGKLDQPDIVGQISLPNYVNQFLQLSANNIIIDFDKKIANLNAPLVKIGDSTFSINGQISTNISNGTNIKNLIIKSKYINTDTLMMYKKQLMEDLNLRISNGKIYSEKAIITMYGSHLLLSSLSSDFSMENQLLDLENITAELFNGKLFANMTYNLKDEQFDSNIQARNVSAAPIFDIISIKKDSVSGIMDFDTKLKGNLTTKESLNGDIKFEVRNGHIGTLGKLEHLLYAQNIVADNMLRTSLSVITKAITLRDTGLFKYLRGDIKMQEGVANIKMLQSQGPLMSLFIKGQYTPATDYGKLTVLGRLSDEIVSGLGAFGDLSMNKVMTMLTGEENKKYNITSEDINKLPPLPMKNTKEFRSIINGFIEKPSSVVLFNWISYTKKEYRQKDIPTEETKVPDFINNLPY